MKRFEELNGDQKIAAVLKAKEVLVSSVELGLIETSKTLTNFDINEFALVAAEESLYTDDGDLIADVNEDYYFQGGCV